MYIEHKDKQRTESTSVLDVDVFAFDFIESQSSDELQTTDALQVFLNELDLLFDVENFARALHKRITDATTYNNFIKTCITDNSICAQWFEYAIDTKLMQGERRDIMLVDVVINKRLDKVDADLPITRQFVI